MTHTIVARRIPWGFALAAAWAVLVAIVGVSQSSAGTQRAAAGFLRFPLDCTDPACGERYANGPYTAGMINTILDHSMRANPSTGALPYGAPRGDGQDAITAFDGERAAGAVFDTNCLKGTITLPFASDGDALTNAAGCRYRQGYASYDDHPGYDYRAAAGTPVVAAATGHVLAGRCELGNMGASCAAWGMVGVDHGNGYITQYAHMTGITLAPGDSVREGQVIGYVGSTAPAGTTLGPHLHFEVYKVVGGRRLLVDPYGWSGQGADPLYTAAAAKPARLWKAAPPSSASTSSAPPSPAPSPPPAAPPGRYGPSIVWDGETLFSDCDHDPAGWSTGCIVRRMRATRATPAAIDFATRLNALGTPGWASSFTEYGRVDLVMTSYPFRANTNGEYLMVNGVPDVVRVESLQLSTQDKQRADYRQFMARHTDTFLIGKFDFVGTQGRADGGQRFIFRDWISTCRACEPLASADFAFDFAANGTFTGTQLLAVKVGGPASAQTSPSYVDDFISNEWVTVTVKAAARVRNKPTTEGTTVLSTAAAGTRLSGRWVKGVDASARWLKLDTGGYVWDGNLQIGNGTEIRLTSIPRLTNDNCYDSLDTQGISVVRYFKDDGMWTGINDQIFHFRMSDYLTGGPRVTEISTDGLVRIRSLSWRNVLISGKTITERQLEITMNGTKKTVRTYEICPAEGSGD